MKIFSGIGTALSRLLRPKGILIVAAVLVVAYWRPLTSLADGAPQGFVIYDWSTWGPSLAHAVKDGLAWFWDWFLDTLFTVLSGLLSLFGGSIPHMDVDMTPLAVFCKVANAWFPMKELFTMLGVYFVFSRGVVLYRVIKSFLPSISG